MNNFNTSDCVLAFIVFGFAFLLCGTASYLFFVFVLSAHSGVLTGWLVAVVTVLLIMRTLGIPAYLAYQSLKN